MIDPFVFQLLVLFLLCAGPCAVMVQASAHRSAAGKDRGFFEALVELALLGGAEVCLWLLSLEWLV